MNYEKINQYKSAIIAFLILFLFFVPLPQILSLVFLWIIIFLVTSQLSGNLIFSLFISLTFIALLVIVLIVQAKNRKISESFIERFEGEKDSGDAEDELLIDDKGKSDDSASKKKDHINLEVKFEDEEPKQKKIPMMDTNKDDEEDAFGKINTGDLEESDEDSDADDDDEELHKKAGKSRVSSKAAYRGQKQLYDLNNTMNKLTKTMESLSPTLVKGQKIIESLEKLGINKFI